jgi:16S rRNA (uracil1498-N3)-methyltransferase
VSVVRLPWAVLVEGRVALDRDASHYVARVRRLAEGDALEVFDPTTRSEADAFVSAVDSRGNVTLEVGVVRASRRLPGRAVTLFQGLGKGDKLDAIVRDATELGATAIRPVLTRRSVPTRGSDARVDRWRRIAIEAARQCGRGDVPNVDEPTPLTTALGGASDEARFLFVPTAREPLGAQLATLAPTSSIALLVGPEGGLDDDEVESALAAGFVPCRLGTFVLRTETMAAAALGAIAALASTSVDAPIGTI